LALGTLMLGAARAQPLPVPPGFGVQARGQGTQVSYSELTGEGPNQANRSLVERTCAMKRQIDPSTPIPVFEAGFDRPNTRDIIQVVAPAAWASYETITGYVCDPATSNGADDVCSCTFREMTTRFVHIRKAAGAATEVIDIDLGKRTGTRRLRKSVYEPPVAPRDLSWFGPVVGHDVIAGFPCSIRRQDLGTGRTERCLADRVSSVPQALQDQQLSQTMYLMDQGAPIRRDWSRTQRIVPDADIDVGVFDALSGIALKTLGAP
jgi:hypothetical protein